MNRTILSIATATFMFAAATCLMITWSGIWTFGELSNAAATYRALPFHGMLAFAGLAGLCAWGASQYPQSHSEQSVQ